MTLYRSDEILQNEEEWMGGKNAASPDHILAPNAIAIVESMAVIRGLMLTMKLQPGAFEIIVVLDRMATIRSLEKAVTRKQLLDDGPFNLCLKALGKELVSALSKHKAIKFVHFETLGFDKNWRPDELSRLAAEDKNEDREFPKVREQVSDRLRFSDHKWYKTELMGEVTVSLAPE